VSTAPTAVDADSAGPGASTGPVIELRGLCAGYDGIAVVRDLDLHVDAGEIVALLGPNGAGKTTTLLTVSGILPALAGDVRVLGRPVSSRRPHRIARRGVAHVPEDRALFYGLSTQQNLRLGRRGSAWWGRRARTSLETAEALELFPALRPLLSRRAGLLSGGEQQMLALARAIVARPKVLMVDEMSMGLAPILVEQLLPTLRTVAEETGAGILLVEQHVHMALELADRAYVIVHGSVVLEDSAAALAKRADVLQASYLGAPPAH
jgi:branched-chain amino acid transport system ATP-binding protein